MFPLPRVVYSMSEDGLLFRFLSKVLPKLKTPYIASLCTGFLAGVLACIFNLERLVELLSLGTLLCYTLVCVCVVILRYGNDMFLFVIMCIIKKKLQKKVSSHDFR